MQGRMPERESAATRPPHSNNPQDYLTAILAKEPDRVKGIRGRSLASTHERGEGVGGARRNRTADNGFADHCLTTWRPRHRTKGDLERRRPRRGGAPAVQFPALEQKLTPLCSASCGDGLLLTGASFIDDGRADEVAPFGPRTVVVTNVTVAQALLQ